MVVRMNNAATRRGQDITVENEDRYIGKQIGNYIITEQLTGGAFGRIYRGKHLYFSNRIVAIKILHLTYLSSSQERENFMQEAQFLEMLKHPNILPIYDVGIDEGFPYLVAEFAPQGSLRDHLQRQKPKILPSQEVLTILTQVGQALQYVHEQNIVHRDLKPENILFNAKGQALLADFGISVYLDTARTKYANVIGSPLYMAPEQFEGAVSRRSDQYALACIAYELMTGKPPFMAANPLALGMKHLNEPPLPLRQINANVPGHIERAILQALAKKRDDRFPDVSTFIAALLAVPTGSLQLTKSQWLDEGNRLFNINHYSEALLAFERSIQLDPSFAEAHEAKGSALYYLGRLPEAQVAYEVAIQLDPTYAPAYSGKANVLSELKHFDEAITFYKKAIQLEPQLVDAYIGKANALYYKKRYEDALVAYEQATKLDPYSVAAFDGKSWTLRQLKRYEEALTVSEQAIQRDQGNASAYNGKGRALFRLKRYEESLSAFNKALQLDPNQALIHDFRADTLYHIQRYEEALVSYERAIQLDSQLASAREGRGDVLCHFRRFADALTNYDQAIHMQPSFGIFHFKKGEVLTRLGRLEEAQIEYERAKELGYKA